MTKRKTKDQAVETTESITTGDAFEPPATTTPDLSGPWDTTGEPLAQEAGRASPTGELSGDNRGQRPTGAGSNKKQRSLFGRYFTDRRVELIDDGNSGGLGIKLSYDDPAERPSDAIKQILKEGDDKRPGFAYRGDLKQWRKRIGSDAHPSTAVAIRLDAERRVEAIGEQMSHEERLKQERDGGNAPVAKTPG